MGNGRCGWRFGLRCDGCAARRCCTAGTGIATETLELVRSQYEAGTVAQIDLLAAQDNVVIAQESLAEARFDAAIADLALRRSAGTFPPR